MFRCISLRKNGEIEFDGPAGMIMCTSIVCGSIVGIAVTVKYLFWRKLSATKIMLKVALITAITVIISVGIFGWIGRHYYGTYALRDGRNAEKSII